MDVISVFFAISLILILGFAAEFIFQRWKIPDVLLLLILGFVLGPHLMNFIRPSYLSGIAPLFTGFALLFLLFDGAFNIDLRSFAKGFSHSIGLTFFNFIAASIVVFLVFLAFHFNPLVALMMGFILGGISSAFVIPIISKLKVSKEVYSILTFESALTDVLCIVFALTTMQIIVVSAFNVQSVLTTLISLFAVAGLVGIIGGILWILIASRIFKHNKPYMMTVAFLLLLFVLTEYLNGNGAIAALFFGLMLRNSKQLTSIFKGITTADKKLEKKAIDGSLGFSVTTTEEEFFYKQISFFLKTFFFVYIGVLLDISNYKIVLLGAIIAVSLMLVRPAAKLLTKDIHASDRSLINSIFGRGLAAATLAFIAVQQGIEGAEVLGKVVYAVIVLTIVLSSARVFFYQKKWLTIPTVNKPSKSSN